MNIKSIQKFVEGRFAELLGSMFKDIKFAGRFTVDKGLEIVKAGFNEERFNVYFDDQFIFSFVDRDHPVTVDRKFLEGFLDAYKDGKIYVNQETYEEVEKQERLDKMVKDAVDDAERKNDLSNLSADEQQIADKILTDVKG